MRKRLFVAMGLACCLALVPGLAWAWHADVSGSEDCKGTLTYTVRAWNGPDDASRTNSDVRVKVDGKLVQTGEFTKENGFQFSGTVELGAPKTVVVWAKAFANWANGGEPGPAKQVTVEAPKDCPTPSSSTSPSSSSSSSSTSSTMGPTTTETPSTTIASTTTAAPTTTAPVPSSTVSPTTIIAPTTTTGGALPFTGSNAVPMLLAGLVLVAGGALALRFSRRSPHRDND